MTIELADDLAAMLTERAAMRGETPAAVADTYLRERLTGGSSVADLQQSVPPVTEAEWFNYYSRLGRPIGANLTDEQLSSEALYD